MNALPAAAGWAKPTECAAADLCHLKACQTIARSAELCDRAMTQSHVALSQSHVTEPCHRAMTENSVSLCHTGPVT